MFVCAAAGGLPDSCCMSLPVCVVIINSSCTDNSAKHAVPTPIITPHPNNCINTILLLLRHCSPEAGSSSHLERACGSEAGSTSHFECDCGSDTLEQPVRAPSPPTNPPYTRQLKPKSPP